ncbi:MAG: alkaline phosphatase family protein [Candidatus Nanohaloarchaea archaeon]
MTQAKETDNNKVVVVALDGASYDLMNQCIKENDYSNIETLGEQGSFKPMDSTLPALTPSAMASFLTDRNPGGTGVYGFEQRSPFSYETSVVNSRSLGDTFPEDMDNRSILINVPMTYPAPKINGVVVSGFPGSTQGRYAYPPTIKKDLKEMNYTVTTAGDFENNEELKKEVFDAFKKRRDLSLRYMDKYDWEYFMVMFTGDARLEHFMGPENCSDALGDYYGGVDEFIGNVREKTPDNTTIILASNHGFQPLKKKINLYTFLKNKGYLAPKQPLYWENFVKSKIGKIEDWLGLRKGGAISSTGSFSSGYMDEIDWSQTKAYTGAYYNGQIFINLKGREPQGTVKEEDYEKVRQNIIEDLKQLRDPETGEKVVSEIHTKDEIYSGDKMDRVPDIVFETPGYNHVARFGFGDTFLSNPVEKASPHPEGFVMSNREVQTDNNTIMDLSRTVVDLLGVDIGDKEGRNMFSK